MNYELIVAAVEIYNLVAEDGCERDDFNAAWSKLSAQEFFAAAHAATGWDGWRNANTSNQETQDLNTLWHWAADTLEALAYDEEGFGDECDEDDYTPEPEPAPAPDLVDSLFSLLDSLNNIMGRFCIDSPPEFTD